MKINLIEYFEETQASHPEKIAVIDGQRKISFKDLAQKAKSLSADILSSTACRNKPIAVFLPKCIETICSDLAITYSGNAFMNLDVKTPSARTRNVISLVKPEAIITDGKHLAALKEACPDDILIIDIDTIAENSTYSLDTIAPIIDTDPFCIINTSGSTGTPKGVVLNHRSFFDFLDRSLEAFEVNEDERIGSLSPVIFDIYVLELCLMMSKSDTIVLIPETLSAFPASILKIVSDQRLTFLFWVPTIMVNIANMDLLDKYDLTALKTIWFAGEVFPTKQFNIWRRNLPQVTFANLYGPIEITLDCVFYIIRRPLSDEEPIPIGYPYRNTDILVLDDNDQLVTGPHIDGELCVRGSSLAMGYYNNPEKTAAAFVQNPLNTSYPEIIYRTGDIVYYNDRPERELVFKGRKDNIVKHLGYRTDLGEIEHVIINNLKLVRNGCVVYNHTTKEIILFYESDAEIQPGVFRNAISQQLPRYMIPTKYFREEKMKMNPNGKIDRLYYKNIIDG